VELLAAGDGDALLGQHLFGAHRHEGLVGGQEGGDDGFVLLGQQAAGGVHQAAARLHEARRAGQDRRLLGGELGQRLGALAPLEVGVAAQGAEAAARRIDQHPVDLAGQALDARVVLAGDDHRVDVGQARAGDPRLELAEPLVGHVEGVQAAGVAHQRAEQQGLAAGAGAEVDHHLAALGLEQEAQQLAAFVLHLEAAVEEERVLLQRRLALEAHRQRREAPRRAADAVGLELVDEGVAVELEGWRAGRGAPGG
jgi:hypothetical protein